MTEIREIFKTIQKYFGLFMNSGDENSNYSRYSECNEKSQSLCNGRGYFANAQYDEIKPVIVSESETIQPIVNQKQLQGNKYAPTSKSKISVLPQGVDMTNSLAPCGRGKGEGFKAAFTLAEVLITLGIIGVVAALTLPTLIQNHQKQVYVTQLKKAYSTLNNAINKMAADEGVVDWAQTQCGYQWHAEEATEDNPYPYINPACTNNLAKQMNVLKVEADYFADCSDWCKISGGWGRSGPAIMTADGITYQFDCTGLGYVYVDVNGTGKGPNKYGRDVFGLEIDLTDNKIIPEGSKFDAWKNCSATNLSTNCTAKVLIEGKMNY